MVQPKGVVIIESSSNEETVKIFLYPLIANRRIASNEEIDIKKLTLLAWRSKIITNEEKDYLFNKMEKKIEKK
mgnify:FL=1